MVGQEIDRIALDQADGQLELGAELLPGVYFAQIRNGAKLSGAVKLVKQ